jgi:hypothetical protein
MVKAHLTGKLSLRLENMFVKTTVEIARYFYGSFKRNHLTFLSVLHSANYVGTQCVILNRALKTS